MGMPTYVKAANVGHAPRRLETPHRQNGSHLPFHIPVICFCEDSRCCSHPSSAPLFPFPIFRMADQSYDEFLHDKSLFGLLHGTVLPLTLVAACLAFFLAFLSRHDPAAA